MRVVAIPTNRAGATTSRRGGARPGRHGGRRVELRQPGEQDVALRAGVAERPAAPAAGAGEGLVHRAHVAGRAPGPADIAPGLPVGGAGGLPLHGLGQRLLGGQISHAHGAPPGTRGGGGGGEDTPREIRGLQPCWGSLSEPA